MKRVQKKRDRMKLVQREMEETHTHKETQPERQSDKKLGGELETRKEIQWETGRQRSRENIQTEQEGRSKGQRQKRIRYA